MRLDGRHSILVGAGFSSFLDVEALEDLQDLPMIVAGSDLFLLVLSDGVLESQYCLDELAAAVEVGMPIVLVVKEGARWRDESGKLKADFPSDADIARLEPSACRRGFSGTAIKHSNEYYSAFSKKLLDRVRGVIDPVRQKEPGQGDESAGKAAAMARRQKLLEVRDHGRVQQIPGSHAVSQSPHPPTASLPRPPALTPQPARIVSGDSPAGPAIGGDVLGEVMRAMQQQAEQHARVLQQQAEQHASQQAALIRAMERQAEQQAEANTRSMERIAELVGAMERQAEAHAAAMTNQLQTVLELTLDMGGWSEPQSTEVADSPLELQGSEGEHTATHAHRMLESREAANGREHPVASITLPPVSKNGQLHGNDATARQATRLPSLPPVYPARQSSRRYLRRGAPRSSTAAGGSRWY